MTKNEGAGKQAHYGVFVDGEYVAVTFTCPECQGDDGAHEFDCTFLFDGEGK